MQRLANHKFILNNQRLVVRGHIPQFRTFYSPRPQTTSGRMGIKTDIVLYTASTPNGVKVPILLEELGLEYKLHPVKLRENEQKQPWFLDINPNGRIPALTDTFTNGKQIRLFESAPILEYLTERYDDGNKVSYPKDSPEYWEVKCWLSWQIGGLGPMQGQLEHFGRYATQKIEYGINRYGTETNRLYSVMEAHLAKSTHGFLVGDRVTIADIACVGWVANHELDGISLDEYPYVEAWLKSLLARPSVEKGRHIL